MAKSICLYFQIHQPTRLRQYRFFDIGKDSHYYDDFANRTILRRVAQRCYLPMNEVILGLLRENRNFKVAFSISGSAIEQFDRYAPEVLDSFRQLAQTGQVEFLCETYNHSLASLASPVEFSHQVMKHKAVIEKCFGQTPAIFRNTELIYNNSIGEQVFEMGFKGILTEGARHIMGWKSPNYIYACEGRKKLAVLLRNYALSDDIAFRFSDRGWENWPLTGEKYLGWLKNSINEAGDVVNLFMDYETFGEHQSAQSGIFEFIKYLVHVVQSDGAFEFNTPSEVVKKYKPVDEIDITETISWADEERDVTAWLGNELQQEAFNKLYGLYEKLSLINDSMLWNDFGHLQESDHFYYMCTKFFSDGEVHKYFNPYDTPYEAFINYMNVLSDFILRVNDEYSIIDTTFAESAEKEEVARKVTSKPVVKKKTTEKAVERKKVAEKPVARKSSAKKTAK